MFNSPEELYDYIIDKVTDYKMGIGDSNLGLTFNVGVPYKDPLFYVQLTCMGVYVVMEKYHLKSKLGWICPYDDIGKYL